jgi:cytosine/adenosine deaminase-related metal-dependent hydrolase
MKILFKNARLLPEAMPAGTRAEDTVNVVVTDESITYIGVAMPEETFDRTVDCKENLLMPAFYNAH